MPRQYLETLRRGVELHLESTKQGLAPATGVRCREPGQPAVHPHDKEHYQVCSLQLPDGVLPLTAVCMSPTEVSAEKTPSNSQEFTKFHPNPSMWTYPFQQSGTFISFPNQRLTLQRSNGIKGKASTIMLGLTMLKPIPTTFYYYSDFLLLSFLSYLTPGTT